MKYNKIKEGIFLARPNRFIANVIVGGEMQTVHVKNTGRCRELLREGATVYLEDHEDNRKARKTGYSLIAVQKRCDPEEAGYRLVNIDSYAPNRVVGEGLADGSITLPGLRIPYCRIKPEVTYGASRFDFYVEDAKGKKAFIEVKGCTLEEEGTARFPDAPTERGLRHVKELCGALDDGFAAYIIFVIQMKGVSVFEPNDATHRAFGEALREANKKGVAVLAYNCRVTPETMEIGEPVRVKL
jgi:sugar fermentation stimulation protein A